MTEKEKIRNELMLRLTNYKETLKVSRNSILNLSLKSKINEVESLLSFIDFLPEELVNENLEEAAKKCAIEHVFCTTNIKMNIS